MKISDNLNLLTPAQKSLLEQSVSIPFMMDGFKSLDDILTKLKVDVHIEPGKPTRSVDDYYEKAMEHWQKVLQQIKERIREDKSLEEEYSKILKRIKRLSTEQNTHSLMRILGLYDSQKNIIILYPEAMADADTSKMDEYLVSTFAHEVMHAYFNRPGHEHFPYAMFVEEPLAEFGMLLYMYETHSPYYDWVYGNVSSKKCCYGYGANIMDQYLGGGKSLRKYIEEYKIFIGEYEMLDEMNGNVSLPMAGSSVNIGGKPIMAKWTPVCIPPTYFWDDTTKTLGLDGVWCFDMHMCDYEIEMQFHMPFHRIVNCVEQVYIGKDFVRHNDLFEELFSSVPVTVFHQNKELTSINGIPVLKEDNTPVIKSCGDGCYELKRNGKYGIIDSNLKNITPFKYDSIWSFNDNGLCRVRIDMPDGYKYGYVNAKGEEQIAVKYDHIYSFENGLSVAKLNGFYGIINEKDEVVAPFNLDYPDMRGLRNGYATMKDYNGKWGAIDAKGQVVIPCEYDSLIVFDESGVDTVSNDGEEFLINTKGERLS